MNKTLYASVIVIILVLVAVPFFLLPQYENLKEAKEKIETKKRQAEKERKYSETLKSAYYKIFEYKDELRKIDSAIPENDLLIPEFYNFLEKKSLYSGIIMDDISVGGVSEVDASLQKTNFTISFYSTYPTLKRFLSNLHNSARLIEVESVLISPPEEESSLRVTLNLGIYSYNKQEPQKEEVNF